MNNNILYGSDLSGDPKPHISEHAEDTAKCSYGLEIAADDCFNPGLWIEALEYVARLYSVQYSPESIRIFAKIQSGDMKGRVRNLAQRMGLNAKIVKSTGGNLTLSRLPAIVALSDGSVGTIISLGKSGSATIIFSGDEGLETTVGFDKLEAEIDLVVIARPLRNCADERVDAYIKPYQPHWFRQLIVSDWRPYIHVMIASVTANLLALSGIMFSMQVYDRVIPADSIHTLYVLFSGVVLAVIFDFILKKMRSSVIDLAGKKADLQITDLIFGRALRIKEKARPRSTGVFIAQLRDLEHVRELLTSTTVAAIADLPFFFLFLIVFWSIGGALVIVPALALIVLVLPGLLLQGKLRQHTGEAMREASLRNAMLVESIQGLEDIKTLQAEEQIQRRWNHLNTVTGDAQLRQRALTTILTSWGHSVQTSVFAVIVCIGAPMVIAGTITTGTLVACSILGSRMMAPMAQLTQVLAKWQHAKVGLSSLDKIMQLPVDHPDNETRVSVPHLRGDFKIRETSFYHGEKTSSPAVSINALDIKAGERISILGRNGAGKSTFLMALAGLIEPEHGDMMLDGMAIKHIDPADIRRETGILTQNSTLFHGTIRENLLLGKIGASAKDCQEALALTGAIDFVGSLSKGLDHQILEGGRGLSGGQQQALLLSRILIRDPSIILLDEPTASMDETSERKFLDQFQIWSKGKTVLIATHRMRVLDLTDRIIAFDNGKIILDEPKAIAIPMLTGRAPHKGGNEAFPTANHQPRDSSDDCDEVAAA